VLELLQERDLGEVMVFVGGIIPDEDAPALCALGVRGIYGPGTPLERIVQDIRNAVGQNG